MWIPTGTAIEGVWISTGIAIGEGGNQLDWNSHWGVSTGTAIWGSVDINLNSHWGVSWISTGIAIEGVWISTGIAIGECGNQLEQPLGSIDINWNSIGEY